MKKHTTHRATFFIAFLFLAIPNFNIIDFLPDFISYFLLARLLRESKEIVPHFAEAHSALTKLGWITLSKIPASFVMFFNMYTGRDIVPLFTLIYAVTEGILLFYAITNAANGLFYLGERTGATSLLSGTRLFGVRISSDGLKWLTIAFAITKSALTVLPEFCLLSTSDTEMRVFMSRAYPILLITAMAVILVFGITWMIAALGYAARVSAGCDIKEEINGLAGEKKLAALARQRRTRMLTGALTVLACASLFSFDIAFENTNGINILPHFIWGMLLGYSGFRLFDGKRTRIALLIATAAHTVISLYAHYETIRFYDSFDRLELMDNPRAEAAYRSVELAATLEFIAFAILIGLMIAGFVRFIRLHTGVLPTSDGYSKTERGYHRRLTAISALLFSLMLLISAAKCADVFLDAKLQLISSATNVIIASAAPWMGSVLILVSVLLVAFSFYFLSGVKADVRFKYDEDDDIEERGRYE